MPLGVELGLSQGEFVLDGDPAPSQKGGRAPSPILRVDVENFEIGPALLVIANFVGNQLPSPKRGPSPLPIFGPFLLWPNAIFVALEQQKILVKTTSEMV